MAGNIQYPNTRRDDTVVDDFFGTKVKDPYRWLEDPDSEETKQWVEAQNKVTDSVLAQCSDRERIFERLKELQNYERYSSPFKRGDKYFFWKNDGLQNQSVLYIQDTLVSEPTVFLDPNKMSEDGTTSIGLYSFSESGKLMAYAVHQSGSDWKVLKVRSVDTGKDLDDLVEWVKFSSIAWTHDEKGFYYSRYPAPQGKTSQDDKAGTETDSVKNQRVYYHVVGTPQSEDQLIFGAPGEKEARHSLAEEPDWMFGVEVSDDGRYFLLTVSESTERRNRFYFQDLQNPVKRDEAGFVVVNKFVDVFEAEYQYLTNDGSVFYMITNKDAPRMKVVSVDVVNPKSGWKDVIPESEHVLQTVLPVNNQFVVSYLEHVNEKLYLYSMTGEKLRAFELPTLGTVTSLSGKRKHTEFFYQFTSFLHPGIIFHYDFPLGEVKTFRTSTVKNFDPSLFETEQIFYSSADGTRIPMFVVKSKGQELTGEAPLLLYGYGGFNISITPAFAVSRIVWMQHFGGIYAVANIRGGEEYGEDWHQGGIKDRKQNVFDDFQAAAKTLIDRKYTKAERLAIMGGSNGGLLTAACMIQQPQLFGAVVAQVRVLDMLRFHRWTIGYAWCSDYGCADNKDDFPYLYKYSPLHNVKPAKYPALLLTTGDHDDRVVPAHSFKFISEVQHVVGSQPQQDKPLVIRIEVKAGHGHGKPIDKVLREAADTYGFLAHFLAATWKE